MSDQSQGENSLIDRQPRQPSPMPSLSPGPLLVEDSPESCPLPSTWIYLGEAEGSKEPTAINYGEWSRVKASKGRYLCLPGLLEN